MIVFQLGSDYQLLLFVTHAVCICIEVLYVGLQLPHLSDRMFFWG